MKTIGIFEIKTKLSRICEDIARSGESVLVTRRGEPLVRIVPLSSKQETGSEVWEAWETYNAEGDTGEDFSLPDRSIEAVGNPFSEADE